MVEDTGSRHHQHQVFNVSEDPEKYPSSSLDDDGRHKRTGTAWTAGAHIITAVIGSGVLSLAWAMAQLGWIAGPFMMILFSAITYYTSTLLASCYRTGDPDNGKRNYTYMDAVQANLGGHQVKLCGIIQYLNLFGTAIGYTIASSISMMAIARSNCFHQEGHDKPCRVPGNLYMIAFGIIEIIFSQIPNIHDISWLSIVAAIMSFTYSAIGLSLGVAKVRENRTIKGNLTGKRLGGVTKTKKMWTCFQSLGAIAFAYNYSFILIEIQDTIKSPPSEYKTMKKATFISIAITTVFYMLCGCFGYAAFGDSAPGNLLTGFGFYDPYWLVDLANTAVVIHLVGSYQIFSQPFFAFVENKALEWFPNSALITKEIDFPIPGGKSYRLSAFRLVWRSIFVIITTTISMLTPFFTDIVGILGALAFWPLAVHFPIEMYLAQRNIPKWSPRWISHRALSMGCMLISTAAVVGSVIGVKDDLKGYKPFHSNY